MRHERLTFISYTGIVSTEFQGKIFAWNFLAGPSRRGLGSRLLTGHSLQD